MDNFIYVGRQLIIDSPEINLLTNEEIKAKFEILTNLGCIKFHNFKIGEVTKEKLHFLFELISNNDKVKSIIFQQCAFNELQEESLGIIYNSIKENVSDLSIIFDNFSKFCPAIDFLKKLSDSKIQRLDLSHNSFGENDADLIDTIPEIITRPFEYIDIGGNYLARNMWSLFIIEDCIEYATLEISLYKSDLGVETIPGFWKNLFDKIDNNYTLKVVSLSYNHLYLIEDEEEFMEIWNNFIKTTKLEILDVTGNNFSHNKTIEFLKSAQENEGLKFLCTGNNADSEIGDFRKKYSL